MNTELNIKQLNTNVAQRGDQVLTLIAEPIMETEFASEALDQLVKHMQDRMDEHLGVGIAAPQVYVSKRVIIVASRPNLRYPDAPLMDPIIMVNPIILQASHENVLGEEGCLSVPEQRGLVLRSASIRVRYHAVSGEVIEQNYQGFPARIIQHEIDHLNGILFVDHLENTQ